MTDNAAPSAFVDAWTMLHEGGFTVETRTGAAVDASIAMRTLLQLDGDCMTHVDAKLMAALPRWERLRLAARHSRDVRARSRVASAGLLRIPALLRAGLLACFGAGEFGSVIARIAATPAAIDWHGLLRDQCVWVVPLLAHWLLPYVIRLATAAARDVLEAAHRVASKQIYEKLIKGEPGLP